MTVDLFAGIPVSDYAVSREWYERLLGAEPSFLAHDTEAVWVVVEHGWVYVVQRPERAGRAEHTLFVEDLDARLVGIAERGIEPTRSETYDDGVRKVTFTDPDGNEISFGGAPG